MANPNMPTTRYIPRKTKIKTEFVRGITASDLFWLGATIGGAFVIGVATREVVGYMVAVLIGMFGLLGIIRNREGERIYEKIWLWFKFLAYQKRYMKVPKAGAQPMKNIVPYDRVEDKYIFFGTYYGAVIEIEPIEFGLLDNSRQDMVVGTLANAFRRMNEKQSASIINLERAMVLDGYINNELEKYELMVKNVETGALTERELAAREEIFAERGEILEHMNEDMHIFKNRFYYVVYDTNKETLENTVSGISQTLGAGGFIKSKRLEGKELAVFLKNCYDKNFDEREIGTVTDERIMDWITPERIEFGTSKIGIDKSQYNAMTITNYPLEVINSWGYNLFNMAGCRTSLNFRLVDPAEAEKLIDKAIIEMKTQMENSKKSSYQIERSTQLETITDLLYQIKRGNESVYDCNFHLIVEKDRNKEVKAKLREEGFTYSECYGRQIDVFRSANISRLEVLEQYTRGIPTTTVASAFPFISDMLQDERGVCIGSNTYPVFIDFFKRTDSRVNSNMIIIGKSGSGKSFATKSILTHLAADNTKIFILDPEREYGTLCDNLHGTSIDVGNAGKGRFNPFHIYPAMLDDDGETNDGVDLTNEFDDTFESHLRFLESFFRVVMEGIRSDALESLNGLVSALYRSKGIDKYTDFGAMTPEQFPTFQELYELTKRYHQNAVDDFSRINYRILVTYLEKFAEGGRFSGLWNGPATIKTNENFVAFNFMTLLANKNNIVADAQMLLVFKYLDGEIIKNRDYNARYGTKRKIVIVVDEAHVFINEQRPIALDFMFNMAKRIRKYDGMQIIITQNVKDFVGSPAIAKKSAAIINASQYSMIFSLAPNDMTDLVTLYKNSGEINKTEQQQITTIARGQCFFISGPLNRTLIHIETSDVIRSMFE